MYRYFGSLHGRVSFLFLFYILSCDFLVMLICFSFSLCLSLPNFLLRFSRVSRFFFCTVASLGRRDHGGNRWDKYDENQSHDHHPHHQTSPILTGRHELTAFLSRSIDIDDGISQETASQRAVGSISSSQTLPCPWSAQQTDSTHSTCRWYSKSTLA